jgi:TetR/AcrR family transcriptional repressor of nem operon
MALHSGGDGNPMAHRIMDHAQLLVQTGGYNGFSYAQIADELGIRKATIHYYFRAKSDLCVSLLRRYRSRFRSRVAEVTEPLVSPRERLRVYISLYQQALEDGRLCPCGVLTTELETLDAEIRAEVRGFFDEQIGWVESQLAEARRQGELRVDHPVRQLAASIFGTIEGAMLLAKAAGETGVLADAVAGSMALVFA